MTGLQTVWGWQPALYLFLGGMGAGAFIMTALLYFQDRTRNAHVVCVSSWAAAISLIVGLLLLLSELTNPLRGMMLWQSFSHFTSWMTFGAWAVFVAVVVFGLMALLSTTGIRRLFARPRGSSAEGGNASSAAAGEPKVPAGVEKTRSFLAGLGIALGVVVAAYTGILLMSAPGVPLWNTSVLPLLFTVSAFDTGIALVEIIAIASKRGVAEPSSRFMQRSVVVLVAVELLVLAVFLGMMPGFDAATGAGACARASASTMISGGLAAPFWILVVVCGLALPLAAALLLLTKKAKGGMGHVLLMVGASGALLGGCALRFLVLAAGSHIDVVAQTVSMLL